MHRRAGDGGLKGRRAGEWTGGRECGRKNWQAYWCGGGRGQAGGGRRACRRMVRKWAGESAGGRDVRRTVSRRAGGVKQWVVGIDKNYK